MIVGSPRRWFWWQRIHFVCENMGSRGWLVCNINKYFNLRVRTRDNLKFLKMEALAFPSKINLTKSTAIKIQSSKHLFRWVSLALYVNHGHQQSRFNRPPTKIEFFKHILMRSSRTIHFTNSFRKWFETVFRSESYRRILSQFRSNLALPSCSLNMRRNFKTRH